jgi:hypothetical protein
MASQDAMFAIVYIAIFYSSINSKISYLVDITVP